MIRTPLKVFVFWHEKFQTGKVFADDIFNKLSVNEENIFSINTGIPIFFNTKPFFKIPCNTTQHIAVVLFIEKNMICDEEWIKYISTCNRMKNAVIYPVQIGDKEYSLPGKMKELNYIRLDKIKTTDNKKCELIFALSHEFCRLLFGIQRIPKKPIKKPTPPVKLFLSHSKKDGEKVAKQFDFFISKTSLQSFFDAKDIQCGRPFSSEIKKNVISSVIVVFYSDNYSTREWCQREVLVGKEYGCPIVIIDLLDKGEFRRFPYMANVKVIHKEHGNDKKIFKLILTEILIETLRIKFQEEYINYSMKLLGINVKGCLKLNSHPELLTLLYTSNMKTKIIVYPDPPINDNEKNILKKLRPFSKFVTLSMLPSLSIESKNIDFLKNKKIALSISESEDISVNGFTNLHLEIAFIEIVRYLIACGANILYGGFIGYRGKNFLNKIIDIVNNYYSNIKEKRITNYFTGSFPVSVEQKASYIDIINFKRVDNRCLNKKTELQKALDLTAMREKISHDSYAHVYLGGKITGFSGKYPGVIEEAYLAMKGKKPVYFIGSFGGATKCIIEALRGNKPAELTFDFQKKDKRYQEFYNCYNSEYQDKINYENMVSFFNKIGVSGLKNGLSKIENELLFTTDDMMRAISLILKGLKNIR